MGANILLFVCTNILGAIDYYIADRKQRRSVLETRQSLEVKITLESENLQQVCFLFNNLYYLRVCASSARYAFLFFLKNRRTKSSVSGPLPRVQQYLHTKVSKYKL